MSRIIYTIGHSNHTREKFINLLQEHAISAVADVRSQPYSKYTPQFNREALKEALKAQGIAYVFLGEELGARSSDLKCFDNGKVQYGLLAQTGLFRQGIMRLLKGVEKYRVALMCAEADPLSCHRTILICRNLRHPDLQILHILPDSRLEENTQTEQRLMQNLHLPEADLFSTKEELIELAYDLQGKRIAYVFRGVHKEVGKGK
jgi:uncharacterized protein (DUF488 family)